jgi:membrane-associated HD superfamily phosphohydrolase
MKNFMSKDSQNGYSRIDFASSPGVKFLIGILTFFLLFWMMPEYENIESKYEVGTVWSAEDLIAPFSFPIYKDEMEYEQEKKDVMKNLTPVFDKVENSSDAIDSVDAFVKALTSVLNAATELELSNNGYVNSESLDSLKQLVGVRFTYPEWETIHLLYKNSSSGGDNGYTYFTEKLKNISRELSSENIVDLSKEKLVSKRISVKEPGNKLQQVIETDNVLDTKEAYGKASSVSSVYPSDSAMSSVFSKSLQAIIKPNLIYNSELSELEKQNRIEQIPKTIGIVRENERVISKHDPVNRLTKMKLDSYKRVRLEKIGVQDILLQQVGKFLTVFVLLLVLIVFLYYIRPAVYEDNLQLLILGFFNTC